MTLRSEKEIDLAVVVGSDRKEVLVEKGAVRLAVPMEQVPSLILMLKRALNAELPTEP